MKKTMLGFAMCALFFASCSKESGGGESSAQNSDQVNFISSTTRAPIVDLPALRGDVAGFVVYGTSAATPAAWATGIDGTNNYRYSSGAWSWTSTQPAWPTTTAGYPMNFYAYYASNYKGFIKTTTPIPTVSAEYTIQDVGDQVDLLGAKASAASKPASGQLVLNFEHLLSKINFMIVPGLGADVYMQSLGVNNVGNKRTYNFMTAAWGAEPALTSIMYPYQITTAPATKITGTDPLENTPMLISPVTKDLMLMPQTNASWVPTSNVTASNTYMSFIYRIETGNSVNAIGYQKASDHPNFSTLPPATQAAIGNQPLFIKAGYAFAPNTFIWEKGKGYTYNIQLGTAASTNGYLLDNRYYDKDGNPVNLLFGDKKPGDPVSSGTISFLVTISDWANSSSGIK